MKKNLLFVLSCALASVGFAQTREITNFDLEKFKRARLKAEKELRENYKQLGFPSPEKLRKQMEKNDREFSEFLRQLRAERIEREKLQIEREKLQIEREKLRAWSAQQSMQRNSQRRYRNDSLFTDYRGYYGVTYIYPNYGVKYAHPNSSNKVDSRNNSGSQIRVEGRSRTKVRNQNQIIGVSGSLTRQNMIKSRNAETAFRNRLFFGFGTR